MYTLGKDGTIKVILQQCICKTHRQPKLIIKMLVKITFPVFNETRKWE